MSIRVHDLAKRCGLSNKEMIDKLHAMNYPVKSHSSTVDKITAESIEKEYGYVPPALPAAVVLPVPTPPPVEVTPPPAPPPVVMPAKPISKPAPIPATRPASVAATAGPTMNAGPAVAATAGPAFIV